MGFLNYFIVFCKLKGNSVKDAQAPLIGVTFFNLFFNLPNNFGAYCYCCNYKTNNSK